MPDIFTATDQPITTKGINVIKPVREATPLVIGKIVFALLLPLLLYIGILFTAIEIRHLFTFDQDWSWEFFFFLLVLLLIQSGLVLVILLQWKNHEYYLTDKYIQENKGIITKTEKLYDLKNVRDISVRQGILGRMWNYGDIIIKSTAPNFEEDIVITAAPEPHQHESFLRQYI